MFRALAAVKKESNEGFDVNPHSDYVRKQTATFNQQYPNLYPTVLQTSSTSSPSKILENSKLSLSAWNPNTRQPTLRDFDISKYATSIDVNSTLESENNVCKTTPLDILINVQNPSKEVRCGWIYKAGRIGNQPAVSEGALGIRSGPAAFTNSPKGTWYWNLNDAKKQITADRCVALTKCTDVGSPGFEGCAYSTKRGTGVPVDARGNLLYPRDSKLTAPENSIIRNASACPPPPSPNSPQAELERSRDVCMPMPNGQLSRDCMLQQITIAGCKDDGQLYQSLVNDAAPGNYAAGLTNVLSFKTYQERASPPLLDSIIRQGGNSLQVALDNFKTLAKESQKVENTALSFAARDLCLKKGIMEQYDFCDELNPNSRPPFDLDCLQKAFLRAGGQGAGSEYPTVNSLQKWNNMGPWKNVLDYINNLKTETNSQNQKVQRDALAKFLGVNRESQSLSQIGKIVGIEVFWFNQGNDTFIGRRITTGNGTDFPRIATQGIIENTGLADKVEYLAIVNLRPPTDQKIRLRLESDDGIIYTKNMNIDSVNTQGKYFDSESDFGANWTQPPTRYDQKTCWSLNANGPNYINGWWQDGGGNAHSQIYYSPCVSTNFQRIPSDWMTLTQEPDAPMLSWEGTASGFNERRMPTFFELVLAGASLKENKNGYYPYETILELKRTSSAEVRKNISANAWRTLTLSFIPGNNPDREYILLTLGSLKITLSGNKINMEYNSATMNIKTSSDSLITDGKTPHYLYVNIRSDYSSAFPNRITFAIGTNTEWLNGTVRRDGIKKNSTSFTTTNNIPIFNSTDSAQLILGDRNRIESAEVLIGSIRIFDYELDNNDILRDIKNEWLMMYY